MALDQAHDEAQMGFLDHLEELRRRLFVSAAAIMAAGIGVFAAKDWVFDRILFGPRNWTSSATAVGVPCPTPSALGTRCAWSASPTN